jgi:hypothetical protein
VAVSCPRTSDPPCRYGPAYAASRTQRVAGYARSPNVRYRRELLGRSWQRTTAATGRDYSSASGGFRVAKLQRRPSGDESDGLAGSGRPISDIHNFEVDAAKRPSVGCDRMGSSWPARGWERRGPGHPFSTAGCIAESPVSREILGVAVEFDALEDANTDVQYVSAKGGAGRCACVRVVEMIKSVNARRH